ncbi:MAG TPA: flagellar basal-body MS-ring/collar protein FliF [Nevskiaceae bacterium]|nr:flagellar basal-body MS-ring/collar protein FliF [Nevskiaceae bacterium]
MNPLLQLLRRVPGLQQLLLLVGLAAAVGGGIGGYMWLRGPSYTTAFANLSPTDTAQVTQALSSAGIAYRIDGNGNVQVPANQMQSARMQLGAKGLPANNQGLAGLSKSAGFGVSQFMETARYNYALETDLANTIGHLTGVARAQVHLAIPRPSAFIGDDGQPSASVLVQTVPGTQLDPSQVSAIVHLVASSVPNLEASKVTVVDQAGQLLSDNASNSAVGRTAREMQLTQDYERGIDRKVMNLLAPIVGTGRVRVQSQADMDYAKSEQASEIYHPDPNAVTSETISTHGGNGVLAQGVPGAFSNQPKTPAKVPAGTQPVKSPQAPASAASTHGANAAVSAVAVTRNESRQFAIGRSITHTAATQGRLKRLTVAVLIDDTPAPAPKGGKAAAAAALTTAQLQRIQTLVQSAVGYDKARGDVVTVVNTRFLTAPASSQPTLPPMSKTPWWQHGWVMDLARNLLAILALLVVGFFVIRPALRSLLGSGTATGAPALGGDGTAALAGGTPLQALGGPVARSYEDKVQEARNAVTQDPKRVAQVVHNWVGNDG